MTRLRITWAIGLALCACTGEAAQPDEESAGDAALDQRDVADPDDTLVDELDAADSDPSQADGQPDGGCVPPSEVSGVPLADDTPGRIATACAGSQGMGTGDAETYALIGADWETILEYDQRLASYSDIEGVNDAVAALRLRLDCELYAEVQAGTNGTWSCVTSELQVSNILWSDGDCVLSLIFDGVYSRSVLAEVLDGVTGVEEIFPQLLDGYPSSVRASLGENARFYEVTADQGEGAPNVYVYRVDENGAQLIAEHCEYPEAGMCLVGTGPEVDPAEPPEQWQCEP